MALGSTQPLTEMTARNFPEGTRRPAREVFNLTAVLIVWEMWVPRRLTIVWASTDYYRDGLTF
jgi:hypothetical protein